MNTLSKLPIRVKIFSASIAGILGFMLYFLFVLFSGIDAQSRLSSVRDATFPALELAKNNIVLQERIEELLTTAINTGELEPIEQAQSFFDTLSANTQNLLSLQAQYASSVSDIQNKLDTYHNSAFPLSRQMVEGTVDFSSISKLAADKSSATSALNEALRAYNETTLNAFNKDIKDVDSSLSRTFQVGILIGIGTLIMMLSVSWLISNSISGTVHTITRSLKEIAEGNGDLTKRIPKSSQDELGELVHWFNLFIDKLQNTIREVVDVVNNLSSVSSELNDVTVLTTRVSQKQTTASNHLSATMEDMYGAINNVTSNASSAAEAAADADIEAQNGQKVVNETMTSINELAKEVEYAAEVIGKLEKDTENVGSILSVIQSIAEQTNLLALNAAIEAARAGEQGRGFAVVADEVRTLASRTQDATHEIQTMIEQLQSAAASATEVMNNSTQKASNSVSHADETGKSLREITDKVKVIKNMNGEIAGSTESQQRQAESITQNIKEMSQSAEEASNSTALVSKLSESLQNLANQLSANTSQFKA